MGPTTTQAALFVILFAACDCDDGGASREPSAAQGERAAAPAAETETPATPPEQPEAEAEPAPDVEVDGLTARRIEGGLIEVRGPDRWGGRVDTTYESAEFLKNALPVLERSITEEQVAALRAYVETLEEGD